MILQVRQELFGSAFGGAPLPVVINDGVSKDAVEPRDDAFFVAQRPSLFQATDEGRLQDVLRCGFRLNALLQKRRTAAVLRRAVRWLPV